MLLAVSEKKKKVKKSFLSLIMNYHGASKLNLLKQSSSAGVGKALGALRRERLFSKALLRFKVGQTGC